MDFSKLRKKHDYEKILLFALFLLSSVSFSQTQLFFENFEGGAGQFTLNSTDLSSAANGQNDWIVNNSYVGGAGSYTCFGFPFIFIINNTPSQPVGISSTNGNYAHIVSDVGVSNGITCFCFSASDGFCFFDENNFMKMTNDISTTGFSDVGIDFWWLCAGGTESYGELYYSTNGGSSWIQDNTISQYYNVTSWTNQTITNSAWDNQATLRFGFRFVNVTATSAADPALALDDFKITGCQATTNSFSTSACGSYTVPSGDETYNTPGTQTVMDTIPNTAGCDSIMTITLTLTQTANSITETACFSYTVPSGDETYTTVGTQTVMDTIPNMAGCDSVLTISLTINTVDATVTDNMDGTLTANTNGATYQWLENCDGTPTQVSGQTSVTLPYLGDGWYSCIVTINGCTDTSTCIYVAPESIDEYYQSFDIYPNPSNGSILLDLTALKGQQNLTITDINGKKVLIDQINGGSQINYSLNLENGIYIISLVDHEGIIRRSKLIIE